MVEISPFDMGDILNPLEKRFKKMTGDQKEVYYDSLKYYDKKYLRQAVEHIVDSYKAFPTPGEIKHEYREARNRDPHYKEKSTEVEGCAHCRYGWVKFTKWGNTEHTSMNVYEFSHPCAYCHKEHNIPQVILRDGKIYWANRRVRDKVYVQDMNNLEHIDGSYPGGRKERYEMEEERRPQSQDI